MNAPRFELLEVLQDDPRARRWRAFDRKLECEVLVELPGAEVREHLAGADGQSSLRDAQMLARITHPRVVRLREVAETEDDEALPLLVLDPPVGENLADVLARETTLRPEVVTTAARDLAGAAQAVHAAGVVHRGIAAGNVYVDVGTGKALLTGFTFAKPLTGRMGLTSLHHHRRGEGDHPRALPDYAAPEQVRGKAADHRADVFALGCLLYRCLTGVEAFADGDIEKPPKPPRERNPEVPKRLSDLVQRCLLPVPTARFPNMGAVLEELDAIDAEAATPPTSPHRTRNLLAGGVAAAALGALAVTLLWSGGEEQGRALTEFVRGTGRVHTAEPVAGLEPTYASSWAVLVGTNYKSEGNSVPELKNAEGDVKALEDRLVRLGWDSDKITALVGGNATKTNIEQALTQVRREADRNDQILLYFAVHGTADGSNRDRLLLVPDQGIAKDNVSCLRVSNLIDDFITGQGAKHVLLALDCCHAGLASAAPVRSIDPDPPPVTDSDAPTRYADRESLRRRARWILASSHANELATDGKGNHSPFAQAFLDTLEGLEEGDSLTHTEIYAAIQRAYRDADARQLPRLRGTPGCGAEFLFLR